MFLQTSIDLEVYVPQSGALVSFFPIHDLELENEEAVVPDQTLFAIASSGSGVGLFFNRFNDNLYSAPYIGLSADDAIYVANNFTSFMEGFKSGRILLV